jgi:hypothetical protein
MRCWRDARQILLELVLSAKHEVLIRAKALRAQATAKAVRVVVRASTNLSRAVLVGLLALIVLRVDLIEHEPSSPPPNIEIVQTHPVAPPAHSVSDPKAIASEADTATRPAPAPATPASEDKPAAAPLPPGLQKTPDWTESEIADAKAECSKLLDNITVVTEPLPPEREGACGAPAPRELRSIGESKVRLQPPATLRCPMIAALNTWVTDSLQPAAKKSFGSPVARIISGSYSCRNRYGLARAPISEHALMNAIDISAFVLANGKVVRVSRSWGSHNDEADADTVRVSAPHGKGASKVTVVAVRVGASAAAAEEGDDKAKSKKDADKEAEKKATSEFLHTAHDSACKVFGTILGPDANAAHHDHFHLDMKARKYRSICQ